MYVDSSEISDDLTLTISANEQHWGIDDMGSLERSRRSNQSNPWWLKVKDVCQLWPCKFANVIHDKAVSQLEYEI